MLILILTSIAALAWAAPPQEAVGTSRPADIAFNVRMIDPGFSESVAVADFNKDGRLDILSAEYWYEAPAWTKHRVREIPFNGSYIDNFSDLPVDVDGDGFTDVVQIAYFARRIVWLKNPGKTRGPWIETELEAVGPTEFAFLVDLNNDGKALEILPQFTGAAKAPLTWYELQQGKWIKHQVSQRSYGHGIGAGDVNGDKRNDIVTPQGWLEAPADPRAEGDWTFHPTDWLRLTIDVGPRQPPAAAPAQPPFRVEYGFMHVFDLNKDGRNDILSTMAHSFGVLWLEQRADGSWAQHLVDNTWSRSHASALVDVNGDGQLDFVTGTRFMGRNAQESEPLALYWYEYRLPSMEWTRHVIHAGGEAGAGLQIGAGDLGNDGDVDFVFAGKSGLFLADNQSKPLKMQKE